MAALSSDDRLDGDAGERADTRRHALWGLSVLGLLAVLVITLTVFFSGTPGGHGDHHQRIQLGIPTVLAPPTGRPTGMSGTATPTRRHRAVTSAKHAHSPTRAALASTTAPSTAPATSAPATSAPPGTADAPQGASASRPCTGSRPCTVDGDGGVGAALNAARRHDGVPAATIRITAAAQQCAASGGGQCPGQYAVQTAGSQNGRRAVAALASDSGNSWLFSAQAGAVQIGWAYLPSLGEYVVALLAG